MMTLRAFLISALLVASNAFAAGTPTGPAPTVPTTPPIPGFPGFPGVPGVTGFPGPTGLNISPAPDPEIKTVNGAKEVWIKTLDSQSVKAGDVEVIPKGTKFYHWADAENSARWTAQGKVDPGEVKALDGGSGAVGGGFYASMDFWDSSSYGPKLTVFTTTQDVTTLSNPNSSFMFSKLSWNDFNGKLAKLGIDGVGRYGQPNWFNFFDANPLLNAKAATWQDFEASAYAKTIGNDLATILSLNGRIPLQETPWVKSTFPVISQLLHHTLDVSKLDPNVKDQFVSWLINGSSIQDQSPLTTIVRSTFLPYVPAVLKTSYDQVLKPRPPVVPPPVPPGFPPMNLPPGMNSEWARTGYTLDSNMSASRKLGIPFSSWITGVEQPASIFPSMDASMMISGQSRSPTLPYSQTINQNLAYLNIDDFLSAIAQGKPIDKIYDVPGKAPYSERWQAATLIPASNMQDAPLSIHRALTGNSASDFRDGPAGSDGDIVWQGKKYFQVNDQQIQALKKNPFITPEFQTITDPSHPGKTIQVGRYDYPTAADFEKFSDFLSDATKQALSSAKAAGTLNDVTTPEARALTKQMLSELAILTMNRSSGLGTADIKLFMLSFHAFNEMNAETAAVIANSYSKAFYSGNRTILGKPDEALLISRESFHALALEDSINNVAIQEAFARAETDNPQFPRYFDVPEIWQVGRKISNIGSDPAAFVQQSKAIYAAMPIASCVMKTVDANLNQGGKK